MKKSIRSMSKHINEKLKEYYPKNNMGEWMLRYERISFHELATNRNIKPKFSEPYRMVSYQHGGTLR